MLYFVTEMQKMKKGDGEKYGERLADRQTEPERLKQTVKGFYRVVREE